VIPPWVNVAATVSATSVTLWLGGWRERTLAAFILVTFFPAYGMAAIDLYMGRPQWHPPYGFYWAVDMVELAICLAFALTSNRYWTIWASSLCLLGPATRLVRQSFPGVTPYAYASAQIIWFYLLLAVLVGGAWEARRFHSGAGPSISSRAARKAR
jgi:hypothetical protein